jgi:hypothetical protein
MRIADSFVDELTVETATTKRVLERVPEARLEWQPRPKSDDGCFWTPALQVQAGTNEVFEQLCEIHRYLLSAVENGPAPRQVSCLFSVEWGG